MKSALCVFPIQDTVHEALQMMESYISNASKQHCDMILFPEVCITGLHNTDRPEQDIRLGLALDSEEIHQIRKMASDYNIYTAFGWFELHNDSLYDSALLIDDTGKDILHYQRISKGWFEDHANHNFYKVGNELPSVETKFGKMAFLICGDLFYDDIVQKMQDLKADIILYPFARSMDIGSQIQLRWDHKELSHYIAEWQKSKAVVMAVNYLNKPERHDHFFGGAWFLDKSGNIAASYPLEKAGLLFWSF